MAEHTNNNPELNQNRPRSDYRVSRFWNGLTSTATCEANIDSEIPAQNLFVLGIWLTRELPKEIRTRIIGNFFAKLSNRADLLP